ncbi:MAG: single-stranded DNA-binding protein [Bryobacterales bacterium]|mgnify:CR=1 FL=1|nr:single-stranded DNA-binding protein [Bryobacterales bacterium]
MARSVNKVMLIGNLGRDAETKFTPSGQARTTFSIATTRQWKDRQTGENKEQTDWHNIVAWGKERVADYLKKGKQIYVEGRLTTRSYENNEGKTTYITEVIADDIVLLGGGGDDGGSYSGGQGRQSRGDDMGGHHDQSSNFSASDDDIPF